jgi:hypothetical protein
MPEKSFRCRFGCDHTETQMGSLRTHYGTAHPAEYEIYKANRPDRGGGRSKRTVEPEPPATDAETELLFAASALFAETPLDRDGYGRVLEYLMRRFGPAPLASTSPAPPLAVAV